MIKKHECFMRLCRRRDKKKFSILASCFISKKKKIFRICFEQQFISYPNFQDIINLITLHWKERKYFLDNCQLIYPKIIQSIKFKYDYISFVRKRKHAKK